MDLQIIDYPKLQCPFVRFTNEKGDYVVKDEINPGYEWIFENGVRAVDKLHGTNICVHVKNKEIIAIDNRDTRLFEGRGIPTRGNLSKFLIGALHAADKGWLSEDSQYGELIGPSINCNIHKSPHYLFVPFNYLLEKYHWKSWVQNKYPKTFESISSWFKELPSLFSKTCFGEDCLSEGVVFYHPDGRKSKLRRDMFDWFEGKRH